MTPPIPWDIIQSEFLQGNDMYLCHGSDTFSALWDDIPTRLRIQAAAQEFIYQYTNPAWRVPPLDDALLFLGALCEWPARRTIRLEFLAFMTRKK